MASPNNENQLQAAILGAGTTRCRIATRSGISPSSLSLFMSGKRGLTIDTAAKLASALGLELRPVRVGKAARRGKSQ